MVRYIATRLLMVALWIDREAVFKFMVAGAILSGYTVAKDGVEYGVFHDGKRLLPP